MSAELTPAYIQISADIGAKTAERQLKQNQLTAEKAGLVSDQASLASWQNAGDSDRENKLRRIAAWSQQVVERKALITALEYEISVLTNEIDTLTAQRAAFKKRYNQDIIDGKGDAEAQQNAIADAELAGANAGAKWYKNPVIIGLIVLAVGTGIFLFIKYRK
jgi:hypothetical protein